MKRALALVASAVFSCSGEAPPEAVAPLDPPVELKERARHWTDFLSAYVQIDTTVPPGNEARAFPLLAAATAELGLEAETATIAPGRGNLWARLVAPRPDPGARPLILLHHIDVVPAELDRWTVPPFEALRKDGKLYGRGTLDIKVLGALQLAALERLVAAKDRLKRDVVFLAVADEEAGGRGAQHFVKHVLPELNAEYLLDEGGFAVRSFLNDRDVVVIANAQKRTAKLRLVARGSAGHGSRPIPDGGPTILAEALARIAENPTEMRLSDAARPPFRAFASLTNFPQNALLARLDWPGVLGLLEGTLSSNKNLNPMLRDTLALTMLQAGEKNNVIPSEAVAVFDLRLLPDSDFEAVLARLREVIGDLPVTIEIEEVPGPRLEPAPLDDPLYRALEDSLRAHEAQATITPWMLVGASDSRFFAEAGVKCYGFNPVFVDKAQLDTVHGHDENVTITELERGMTVYAEALERFVLRR